MAEFVKGDVVVIPFPFSDLSGSKRRPAYVLCDLAGDDIILCQITSQSTRDKYAIAIAAADFESGGLPADSFVRPTRIFTADKSIIIRKGGTVSDKIKNIVSHQIIELLR